MKAIQTLLCAVVLYFSCLQHGVATTLLVATDENLPPFSFVREKVVTGIDVDMLSEAARKLGIDLKIVALPWKRVLLLLERGEVHLAMPLFLTPERERFSDFVAPLHYSVTGIFVRKDRIFRFDAVDDLVGKHFGYNRGYALPDELNKMVLGGKIVAEEVSTTEQNIGKLMFGRIDFFVSNTANARFLLRDSPHRTEIAQLPKPLSARRPAYLVASKSAVIQGRDALVNDLRQTLGKLHRDGSYERFVAKYTD